MLIKNGEALQRLNSPLNLMNRLKKNTDKKGMSLFGVGVNRDNETKINNTPSAVPAAENPFQKYISPVREEPTAITPTNILPAEEVNTPKIDTLIDNAAQQIKLASAHDSALAVLDLALNKAKTEMDNIRPDKLPSIITAASKVVEGIRKERNEAAKVNSNRQVHLHFYTPNQRKIEEYEQIEA